MPDSLPAPLWTIVIPVKGTRRAKSRLRASPELAEAIALDTVSAALATPSVRRVMVVTTAKAAPAFTALGAEFVRDPGTGLNAACTAAAAVAPSDPVAFLLGDVPAVTPKELSAALRLASGHAMALVPDAEGEGTVLLTALRPADHSPQFGTNSRAAHLRCGYVELAIPSGSGLRRDVDTREQLAALPPARLGARTAALVDRLI